MSRREFFRAKNCSDPCVFLLHRFSDAASINGDSCDDTATLDLARVGGGFGGFEGEVRTDPTRPEGAIQTLMSGEKVWSQGCESKAPLREGIARTVAQFSTPA